MRKVFFSILLLFFCFSCKTHDKTKEITVLQWNIWHEATMIEGGYESVVNEIARLQPDFVTLSEVRNYNHSRFCDRIVHSLAEKGLTYYSFLSYDTGLLSKYPIKDSTVVYPLNNDHGTIHRLTAEIGNQEFAVYTAHLDYLNDAYYDAKGYDGSTWKERPLPETIEEILTINDASCRDDAIRDFLKIARKDIDAGRVVIIGGDFNEPSHLDWTEETKDILDHNGFVVPWTCTTLLDENGFIDTYRSLYPDVINYPGITYPSDNPLVPVEKLAWGPKADERDRIDYVFYYPHPKIKLKDAVIFGPAKSILKSQRVTEQTKDPFIEPQWTWPTDHKGLLVTFELD